MPGTSYDAVFETERKMLGRALEDLESCEKLLTGVIEKAVKDLVWLKEIKKKKDWENFSKTEKKRLRDIRNHDPETFFRGPWFQTICLELGISPDKIRRKLRTAGLL